jgi:lipopolysaccharide export system protein LptA
MINLGSFLKTLSRLAFIVLICLLAFLENTDAQKKTLVNILQADDLNYNEHIVANAQRLLGHVKISVNGAFMWCDSMYSYTNNTLDAFGNVHIVRGDTLNMYADFVNYNGNSKLAKARRNVRLIDKKITLTTDSLDYTMVNDLASYNYSGTVKDSTNVLNSVIGQYYVNQKKAYFKTKVDVVTKDYRIKSDTLIYFTDTKKVFMEGPTHIFNEKDTLYAEYGWYDSMAGYAHLTKKPRIWNVKQNVKADSIYYDKQNGEGLAMGHARIQDIENRIIVLGNRVQYNDLTKIASASDSAVLISYSEADSLYLHAELLRTMPDTTTTKKVIPAVKTIPKILTESTPVDTLAAMVLPIDTIVSPAKRVPVVPAPTLVAPAAQLDTLVKGVLVTDQTMPKTKKDARLVLAYYKVRFFRKDFQGKCDSLAYWSKDSTIQLYTAPVIWSGKNQITANFIEMINRTKDPDEIRMKEDAFIIAMEDDSIRFNQIKGKDMTGYVRKNELYRIDVAGNGESNYYARDKTGIIGLNSAKSSNITIHMDKGKVKKIVFIKSPEGELKPLDKLAETDKLLPGFNWQEEIRPKNKEDIFRYPVQSAKPAAKPKVQPKPEKKLEE